jgi:hypothetical protein
LTATVTPLSSAKCFPQRPSSFIDPNKWKSDGARSELYGRCSRTVHLNSENVSIFKMLVWSLALSCQRKIVPSLASLL